MLIDSTVKSKPWLGDTYEFVNSFPFYVTRDEPYPRAEANGRAGICCAIPDDESNSDITCFTNIGTITCKYGQCVEFMDIE